MPDFFVLFFDPHKGEYVAIGPQLGATNESAANGTAAINNGTSGKYVALDLSTAVTEHVDVELAATSTPDTF